MEIPPGNGKHPITLIALTANRLAASTAFYSEVFGWQTQPVSRELTAAMAGAGPAIVLRAETPAGFPGMVPFIAVSDVDRALQEVVAAGGSVERATWTVPMAGKLARFKDPSGTLYGLNPAPPFPVPAVPLPFGHNPRPAAGSICSVEMYGADGERTGAFFHARFGWGVRETMPHFVGFDPGAGIGGVFQSHTPALPAVAYLYVDDVGAALSAIVAKGGAKTAEPMAIPGLGTFGYFTDPSGTAMGLIGP
jgi:predicted enzyme related to lactoylglutathione lyase